MRVHGAVLLLIVGGVSACRQSGSTVTDTTRVDASSSAIPAVPSETIPATVPSVTPRASSTTSRSKTTPRRESPVVNKPPVRPEDDSTIIGRDSVMRMPIHRLPTATSTPVRK